MIIIIAAVGVSLMIVFASYLFRCKKGNDNFENEENHELEFYYMQKSEGQQLAVLGRQLIKAAAFVYQKLVDINDNREAMNNLHEERMISEEHWAKFEDSLKKLEVDKMCIEAEADTLKKGFGNEIFREAAKTVIQSSIKKPKTSYESTILAKRKEILEKELIRRLEIKK